MTRPLSLDLRERVVASVLAGESCRSVAKRFGVAVSSVVKWSQRPRATGSAAPGKMGGHRKPVLDPHRAFIVERITQMPHLTLHGLKAELAVRGVKVSHNTVWLFLRREGQRFKKTLFALEQARADVSRRRQRWQSWQAGLDPNRLVFIDETWIKTNMAPLRAGAPKVHACAASPRTVTGAPSHSSARSAMTNSLHLRLRWSDQRRMLLRLREAHSPTNPARRRHRHSRQSRKPQVESCQANDPDCWRQALVPAAIFARPQRDRTGILQDQTLDAASSEAHHRGHSAPHRSPHPGHPASRVP